jgi:transposase InsO family protein
MPWKEWPVSEQRVVLVQRVLLLGRPVAAVAREFGVSRKTACKWLARYRADPAAPLADRSRRPHRSPGRTDASIEDAVLAVRAAHRWGPRKIHRVLRDQRRRVEGLPSIRTVAAILARRGCVGPARPADGADPSASQPFERAAPNELWQVDHKGPVEVARRRVTPLSVLDDHSRYLLRFQPVTDVTMATAWAVLWELFGEVGLPASLLCDNAFGGACRAAAGTGLSWFDARLVRLGIAPVHGRPYHPQTQGKVERLHGTAQRELIDFDARRDRLDHFAADCARWRMTYNALRPHEALGDLPPAVRWRPSDRPRPPTLPEVTYPSGSITRRVSHAGDVRYRNARVLVGRGLAGEIVRVEERDRDVAVYYAWKLVRVIRHDLLGGPLSHKMV